MAIVKWEPMREIEDLFDRYTKAMGLPGSPGGELITTGDWSPRVDISETDSELTIRTEIPGVRKEDVKVSVDDGVLTIKGERKQEKEEKGKKYHRIERHYGSFTRSFTLPDNVDQTKVDATFKDGMLDIQIPKTAGSKPKGIEVKVH